jgi:hypothetical protein
MRETHRTRKYLTLSLSLFSFSCTKSEKLFLCSMLKSFIVVVVVAVCIVVIVVVAPGRKAIFVDYLSIHHCVAG